MSNLEHLTKPKTEQPKLLALDGGGIRGIIALEILAKIEKILQEKLEKDESFVIADYFDYIGGTSTGAIIAACLSIGMKIEKIREFYIDSGKMMFDKARLYKRYYYKYEDKNLANQLKTVFGEETLGSKKLKTLLMMVMRNATTDSPWTISNNPLAKFNEKSSEDCNLDFPLWRLIRASTAAPTFFPPEVIEARGKDKDPFVFVDGGVTPFNNPTFQLFLMATTEPYKLNWDVGEDKMLVVSVGTGLTPSYKEELSSGNMGLMYNATSIPSALMYASQVQQDSLCRVFGKCLAGDTIDLELGKMLSLPGPGNTQNLFTYVRYNAELTRAGLDDLGLQDINAEDVEQMDSVEHIDKLQKVGMAIAEQKVKEDHFKGFLN